MAWHTKNEAKRMCDLEEETNSIGQFDHCYRNRIFEREREREI